MTHTQYARSLGIEPSIITELITAKLLFTVDRKHGPTYYLAEPLPSEDEVIAAARKLYAQKLRRALHATRQLEVEVEAIRNDLLEALEHGLEPVLPLGNDALSVDAGIDLRTPLDSARLDLAFALMSVSLSHRGLHEYDRPMRLARGDEG